MEQNFKAHPFIITAVDYVKKNKSVRFGEMNNWIKSNCSDTPTPYRWEIKSTTNKLYDWLKFFYDEIDWNIPGKRSQIIYWAFK